VIRFFLLILLAGCRAEHAPPNDLSNNPSNDLSGDLSGRDCAVDGSGDFLSLVDQIVSAMRPQPVVIPDSSQRDAFAAEVAAILDGGSSCDLPASYRLVRVGNVRVVAEVDDAARPSPSLQWGSYAAAGDFIRELAVEAPHPIFDTKTESQAAQLFVAVRAHYFLLAGGHRCNNDLGSGCSGTTTACGPSTSIGENYRISDAAHATQLPFWAVHAQLSAKGSLQFLQLHGNSDSCPSALLSDGSGAWPDGGLTAGLATELENRSVSVGRCGAGYPTSTCNLCGTDNVEVRQSAGAGNSCVQRGTTYGRVVHLEQQMDLRKSPQPLIDAVLAAIPQ
jgi:hypothetical protein